MPITTINDIFRTIFGNAATAFAVLSRKWPPFMAFSEGFAIGLCTMFMIVLCIAAFLSHIIYTLIALGLGFATMIFTGFGAPKVITGAPKIGQLIQKIFELLVKHPQLEGYISFTQIVKSALNAGVATFSIGPFIYVIIGLGALATVLACIYTVKPPVRMNRVVWIVSGLAGYFAAFGTVGLAALRDTINTVFWTSFGAIAPILIVEFVNLVLTAAVFIVSTLAEAAFAFAYDFVSSIILIESKRLTRALLLVGLLGLWSFIIVLYFAALSIVTAIFTNILTTVFQALGRRGETSYPGFAYFIAMLIGVAYAGLMIPLVFFGISLIILTGLIVFVYIKVMFAAKTVAEILAAPIEVIKMVTGNTVTQSIWSAFIGYIVYDVVRLIRNSVVKAASKFNASPEIIMGLTSLYVVLMLLTIFGLPGANIISMIYIAGLPILVMSSLLHACVARPPTRARGATTASNIIMHSVTFLLIYSMFGALLMYTIAPPDAIINMYGIGKVLKNYAINTTILSSGFFDNIVEHSIDMVYSPINSLSATSKLLYGKYMVLPAVSTLYVFTPIDIKGNTVVRYGAETRCSFTYQIYKALGEDFDKYMRFEYEIYEAYNRGQVDCKLPTGKVMKCSEVVKKLGEEYFCTYIFYRLNQG